MGAFPMSGSSAVLAIRRRFFTESRIINIVAALHLIHY